MVVELVGAAVEVEPIVVEVASLVVVGIDDGTPADEVLDLGAVDDEVPAVSASVPSVQEPTASSRRTMGIARRIEGDGRSRSGLGGVGREEAPDGGSGATSR